MSAAIRIFGAKNGAGTQVREVQGGKPIVPGPYGTSVLIGLFRSGPVGELVEHAGVDAYHRVHGGITQDSDAPLCCEDFFEDSAGAGKLYTVRLTDGSEIPASLRVYDRNVQRSILQRTGASKLPVAVMTLDAANGGRWAGRKRVHTGKLGTLTSLISGATIDLAFSTQKDAWKGAILTFPVDDSSASYVVTGNTAAGMFTIAGSAFSAATIAGTNGTYLLELTNTHELTGKLEALAVEIGDSGETATGFSLYVHRDGASIKSWENVELDAAGDRYWLDAIAADTTAHDNYELDPTSGLTGDPADAYTRPANFAEIPAPGGVDGNTVEFQIVRWTKTGTGNPYLDTTADVTWGTAPVGVTFTITFTAATTFTVTAVYDTGELAEDLPGGTLGTAWASPNSKLPGFTLRAGAVAAIAGTIMHIYVRPLEPNLAEKGAYYYIAAGPTDGDTLVRHRIVSNTFNTITLAESVDLDALNLAPSAPTMTGTLAGPFDLSGSNLTFIYNVGGPGGVIGPYTLTEAASGAATSATATAALLNALETTRAGAGLEVVLFGVSATDHLTFTVLKDFGGDAQLLLGSGTLNAILGFTNGQTANGSDGKIGRIQYRQELAGGYDGIADVDGDTYAEVFQGAVLEELDDANTGLVRIAVPGITDADAQAAGLTWAYNHNAHFYEEIPDTTATDAAAVAWHKANLAIGPAQDYGIAHFPSYLQRKSPYGSGLYTAPIIGSVLGLTARKANEANGFHNAPAGTDYVLGPKWKDLPAAIGNTRLSSEVLNGYGLVEIRKRGPKLYLWGDRIAGDGGRPFIHERASIQHIGRVLLTNTDALVFKKLDGVTFAEAKRLVIGLFTPWYRDGWFDDADGPEFGKQVLIKVDAANNPTTQRQLGNLNVSIQFAIVGTSEKVIFTIGPKGVAVP